MTTLLVLALALTVLTVSAHGGGGGGRGGKGSFGGGPGFFGGGDDWWNDWRGASSCSCRFWGFWNPCRGVVGSEVRGCPNTNQFLQCTGDVCANQTCPSGQVWNKTLNACAQCADGMHVSATGQVCVCDQGTTFNPRNKTCVACPTDSTQEADRCYCNATKSYDSTENACKDCPQGSTLGFFQQCQCSATQFWNEGDWACQDCPGEWLPKRSRSSFRPSFRQPPSKCTCNGTNQVFDRKTVKCFECPTGTTASRDNSYCACPNLFQFFNMETNKCECKKGLEADPAGTGCVRPALSSQLTTTGTTTTTIGTTTTLAQINP